MFSGTTTWNPNGGAAGTINVYAIALNANTIYAGGNVTTMGGLTRNRIAAIDATGTGTVSPSWNPDASAQVSTIVVDGNTVYAGGIFTTIGGQPRRRIAALDASLGTAIAGWDPNANGSVTALMLNDNKVFVGGKDTKMNISPFASFAVLNNVSTTLPVRLLSFNARSIPASAPKVLCNWELHKKSISPILLWKEVPMAYTIPVWEL